MKINSKYYIEKSREGYIKTNLFTGIPTYYQKGDRFYGTAEKILSVCRRRKVSNSYKNNRISQILRTSDETKKIFEAFSRGSNAPSKTGSGLGLRITRRIMEYHNGKIYVKDSEVGKGTTFAIEIPKVK